MKFKNILIVGGTGFIGYHLANYLIKKNFNVTSISTNKPKKIRKLKKVKYKIVDIGKINQIKKIKNNFDYIVNLGGYVDHKNKKKTYLSHYIGCKNLVKVFENNNIKKFVQIGSSLEYGGTLSPQTEKKELKAKSIYAKSKFLATSFLLKKFKKSKFPAIVLRAYQVYGPRQDDNRLIPIVITNCLKNNYFNCSEGTQSRDFLYVCDFVKAIYKALISNTKGEIINIGYGKPKKVKQIILLIKKMIKKGTPVFSKIKLREDESKILYPSIKKALKMLNWKPETILLKGIKKTIDDYKAIN